MIHPITALFAAAALVLIDQASKALAGRLLADGGFHPVIPGSGLRRVDNRRAALLAIPLFWAAVIWGAAVAGGAVALAHAAPALGTEGALGLGLLLGGATSNLADRVLRGAVLDFISVGPWPTFNLADAAMVAGAVVLIGGAL